MKLGPEVESVQVVGAASLDKASKSEGLAIVMQSRCLNLDELSVLKLKRPKLCQS